ncbi:MAG: hypothetical protein O3A13_11230 [Proteobacteria bacterium]|nr:hypothetical protein [Pseudomonadota bacterium]MDA0994186.1 hypothetical protein [Pseudomonadota bacterium]
MSEHLCTNCGHQFQHRPVGARLVLGAAGAALGRANPYAGIVGIILGVVFGSEIDRLIEKRIDQACHRMWLCDTRFREDALDRSNVKVLKSDGDHAVSAILE